MSVYCSMCGGYHETTTSMWCPFQGQSQTITHPTPILRIETVDAHQQAIAAAVATTFEECAQAMCSMCLDYGPPDCPGFRHGMPTGSQITCRALAIRSRAASTTDPDPEPRA